MKKVLERTYHIYLWLIVLIYVVCIILGISVNKLSVIQQYSIVFLSTLYISFSLITIFNYIFGLVVEDRWYNPVKDIILLSLIFQLLGCLGYFTTIYYPNIDTKSMLILSWCILYKLQKCYFTKNTTSFLAIILPLMFLNVSQMLAWNSL